MKSSLLTTALFVDIGGVLLTNGWGHESRQRAVEIFDLDLTEMNDRHNLTAETFEAGKLTLEEYLNLVVFYRERTFTRMQFQKFMFEQSEPYPLMIELIRKLKAQFGLKIAVVSNESREINSYRIQEFKLNEFVDFFISSCFVQMRKPDKDMFRLTLDLAQVPAEQVVYIDDSALFVQIAKAEGIRSIHHTDYESTRKQLALLGLEIAEEGRQLS